VGRFERARRVPEYVCTAARKVEPIGGDMVRVHRALKRNGAWEDQFTVLMPMAVIPTLTSFVTVSAREISAEVAAAAEHVTH
jgi:hypothetical protein